MSGYWVAVVLAAGGAWFLIAHPGHRLRWLTAVPAPRRPGWLGTRLGGNAARRSTAMARAELPDALDFLAVCLDAGQPMARAVGLVAAVSGPVTGELLAGVSEGLALGRAGPAAWQQLRGHAVWGPVAAEVARSERSGTALAATLRAHAQDARAEARDAATKAARTVGVRSVLPLMACFLPAFVLIGVVPIIASLMAGFFR